MEPITNDPMWGPFYSSRKSVFEKERVEKIYRLFITRWAEGRDPDSAGWISRKDIAAGAATPAGRKGAPSHLDRSLKDMVNEGLLSKSKIQDNEQKPGNPGHSYYRINSLVVPLNYRGDDLKNEYIAQYTQNENKSRYIKELLIFIKEKGLSEEWNERCVKKTMDKLDTLPENQGEIITEGLLGMCKKLVSQPGLFTKREIEEFVSLLSCGRWDELASRAGNRAWGKRFPSSDTL